MRIISIRKGGGLVDHQGKAHAPFTLVDVREGHALRMVSRSNWIRTEDDFLHILDTEPVGTLRQLCMNAKIPTDGDRKELRDRLVAFAEAPHDAKPEFEQAEDLDEYGEAEITPVKKGDSEEAGPSDKEAELREELELKNIQELKGLCGDLDLKKSLPKAELIDQLVEAMR